MQNKDVAEMLDRAARILALRGENRYRIRAYQRAAQAVAASPESIVELVQENRLQSIDGVGKALAAKIKEIVKTGKLALLERMEGETPPVQVNEQILLAWALTFCQDFIPELKKLNGVEKVTVTGEMRRRQETVSEISLLLVTKDLAQTKKAISQHPQLHRQKWEDNTCRTVHSFGVKLRLDLVSAGDYVRQLWLTTGATEHVKKVARLVKENTGLDIWQASPYVFAGEADIYKLAGLPFIEPELRENRGEIAAAQKGELPLLLRAEDYKGDLHVHTNWSDGTASIEKMVEMAVEMGYEYVAITDHSQSLKVARGLSLQRLAEQRAYIDKLQTKYNLRILCGIEADILDDGSIDAPDEILAQLDVVVASVHSGFRQSREKLTARICKAMQNPYVQILGHPTGRLLGQRDPYEVDIDEILRVAKATGTILEINSSPDRLDLTDKIVLQAKKASIKIAINTDAHSQLELANITLGLAVARRGWLTADDVINTRNANEILSCLQKKKTRLLSQ
ncbi:MAG: PHP domain-containing protein [Firmicutes bacterium]|nr:PHP domain-containing protein [Bacillota bacterium]